MATAPPGTPADHDVPFSLERVVFFSDAVFAIAITLLALEVRLPDGAALDPSRLNEAIAGLGPALFSYALSFWVIGQYWLAHWRRYDFVVRADERLAVLNLAQLAFVALIPFPTSLLGVHGDQPGPVVVYAVVVSMAGVFGTASWAHAVRSGLIAPGVPRHVVRLTVARGLTVPIVFAAALVLLLVHPFAVETAWLLVVPIGHLLGRWFRRARQRQSASTPGAG